MTKRAKNHHIVPQVLQKQFLVDPKLRQIWRAKISTSDGKFTPPQQKKIEKAFVIRDYNTVLENNKRSDRVERGFYAPLDDYAGRIIPQLVSIINGDKIPRFSPDALDLLRVLVVQMAKRTPDILQDHDDVELGREVVEATLKSLPLDAPSAERIANEQMLSDEVQLRDKGRHVRVHGTILDDEGVKNSLSKFVPRWAISRTHHSFILASRMVYRTGNGGPNGTSNPNMQMWMPIHPKICLVLLQDPRNQVPEIVSVSQKKIREVNEYAVATSFEVASHSEKLLKSLLRNKIRPYS